MITKISLLTNDRVTVLTPIIKTVINDINEKIFKDTDAKIYMGKKYSSDGVTMERDVGKQIGESEIDVSTDIKDVDQLELRANIKNPRNKVIINDPLTKFNLAPIFVSTTITFNFKYYNPSRIKVRDVLNKLKIYFNHTSNVMKHNIEFGYSLPDNINKLLTNIKQLSLNNDSYLDYVRSISPDQFDVATDRSNQYQIPFYRYEVIDQLGYFTDVPNDITIEKGSDSDYAVEFNYKLDVQRPIALLCNYPLMVNNKSLDKVWLPANSVNVAVPTRNKEEMLKYVIANMFNKSKSEMLRFPTYDEFNPSLTSTPDYLPRLASVLLQVNKNNPNELLNINDLVVTGLPDLLIKYMKRFSIEELTNVRESAVYLELFKGNYVTKVDMQMDETFNITTSVPLEVSNVYHLVISIFADKDTLKINDAVRLNLTDDIYKYFNVQ